MIIPKIKLILKNSDNLLLALLSFLFLANSSIFVFLMHEKTGYYLFLNYRIAYTTYFILIIIFLLAVTYLLRKPFEYRIFLKKMFLLFLPAEIVLVWGFQNLLWKSRSVFLIPHSQLKAIATTLYIVAFLIYLIFYRQGYRNSKQFFKELFDLNDEPEKRESGLKKIFYPALVLLVILLNLGFGMYHLKEFAAVDEPLWTYDRIPKFWNNVADGEFYKTMVSDKPGITVALISGAGLLSVNPKNYEDQGPNSSWDIKDLNFAMRFPILLFVALMLAVLSLFLKNLLGKKIALVAIVFIALSPILLGISTIINPDSLIWIFMVLSIVSYLIYLRGWKMTYLFWTGIFLGLSLLTKYVANILYVFFFGLIILEYVMHQPKYEKMRIVEYFKKTLADYLLLVIFSLLTFIILLPAAWVDIFRLFEGTLFSKAFLKFWPLLVGIIGLFFLELYLFRGRTISWVMRFLASLRTFIGKIIFAVFGILLLLTLTNVYLGMKFYDFESILASPKSSFAFNNFIGMFSANCYSLMFGIIPLAVFFIIWVVLKNIYQKKFNEKGVTSLYLVIFILLYYFASTASNVSATVRYQIAVYPIALILAAIGLFEFFNFGKEKIRWNFGFFLTLLLLVSLYSLNSIKPFYFSYASDLLPKEYVLNLKDMGDGSYEAAQYLNSLPNANDLLVWTDKRGVCVFFVGKCYDGVDYDKHSVPFDYFVVSAGRENRTTKMTLSRFNGGNNLIIRLDKLYDEKNPDYYLKIGGRPNNFVKVISAKILNE